MITKEIIDDKICEILMSTGDQHVDGHEEITDYIISLLAEDEGEGWISVEERLPEKNGNYLCFGRNDALDIPLFETREYMCAWSLYNGERITHWMKLPESPI